MTQQSVKSPFVFKLLRAALRELGMWFKFLCIKSPNSYIGDLIRNDYWKSVLCIGSGSSINRSANIYHPKLFTIGDNFLLGENSILDAGESEGVFIGNNVKIDYGCYLRSANHKFDRIDIPWLLQGHYCEVLGHENGENYSIIIENNVLVGPNVVILSGTHIGQGSSVGAGAVISGKIPPYSIVSGNPGRITGNQLKKKELK